MIAQQQGPYAPYAWVITHDHQADAATVDAAALTCGPRRVNPSLREALDAGEGEEFKMYDDDGILYFTGRIEGYSTGFEPLDDFGGPDSGCTEIRYGGETL